MIYEFIKNIIETKKPETWGVLKIVKQNKEIFSLTQFLPKNCKITERMYCIMNNITERLKCKECDNFVRFESYIFGYRDYCSSKCVQSSNEIKNKKKQTSLIKYGYESWNQSPEIQLKQQEAMLKNHGVKYAKQNKEISKKQVTSIQNNGGYKNIVTKSKKTKLDRYDNENYVNHDKAKITNLEKYGYENPLSNIEIQEKRYKTNLEKYGKKYTLSVPEIQAKIKKTNLEKYGFECVLSNPEIQTKIKKTNLERYSGLFPNSKKHYSKISQKLFWNVYNLLNEEDKIKIYFAELNKEFNILENTKIFAFDFVDSKNKKCIEFNGDRFHANPLMWNDHDTPNPFKLNLTSLDIREYDRIKNNALISRGFEILIIWESDYHLSPINIEEKCLNFLRKTI
jgi:hypothetical protein